MAALLLACAPASGPATARSIEPAPAPTPASPSAAADALEPECMEPTAQAPRAPGPSFENAACVLRAPHGLVQRVRVPAAGPVDLVVDVKDAAVEIVPPAVAGGVSSVRVRSALAFEGFAQIDAFAFATPVELAGGMLRAGPEARLSHFASQGAEVVGRVALGTLRVEPVRVACSALTTTERTHSTAAAVLPSERGFRSRTGTLTLYERLDEDRPAGGRVQVSEFPELAERARRPGFVELTLSFTDGSKLSGWSPEAALEALPPGERGGGPSDGLSLCEPGCLSGTPDPKTHYEGIARVLAGTPVHAEPGGAVWAKVTADVDLHVLHRRGTAWVELIEVPGIEEIAGCHSFHHAVVPTDRVKLPPPEKESPP